LRANVQQGQQALRRLIAGRLVFIPNEKENCYEFNGIGTVRPLLSAVSTDAGVPGRNARLVTSLSVPFSDQVIQPAA
jgi:hypothetical protein